MLFRSLPRGERQFHLSVKRVRQYFNPRSREGSDVGAGSAAAVKIDFNPRSREGSDGLGGPGATGSADFNPRSREGSDSKIAHIRNIFSGNYVNLVKICK